MLTLHIANKNYSSWSLRPWVLMRELGIAFEERLARFVPAGQASPFASFSPNGKVPCLVDDGLAIWDSLAICEYLAERYPAVWPASAVARAWARCAAAEMHAGFAGLRTTCSMSCGLRVQVHEYPRDTLQDLSRLDGLWSDGFERFGGPFIAGAAFTAADAFFAPVAFRIQTYDPPLAASSKAYAQRLLGLASMRDWYQAALAEDFRDAAHEADTARIGRIVEDLRASN